MRMDAEAVDALEAIYAFIDTLAPKDFTGVIVKDRRALRLSARAHIALLCHQQALKDALPPKTETGEEIDNHDHPTPDATATTTEA